MAKLHAKTRNALPDSAFAIVKTVDGKKVRKFPIEDLPHARDALSRAAAQGGSVQQIVDHKVYNKYPELKKHADARKQ